MKKLLLCPLIAVSVLVFSGCDDGGNSSASKIQDTTVTTVTTEPVVTDSDGNTVIEFEKSFLYNENTTTQDYTFLLGNFDSDDIMEDKVGPFLIENSEQLEELNLNYTYGSYQNLNELRRNQEYCDEVKRKISETYDDDFFKENSVVFFIKRLGSLPNKNIKVEKVYKNNGVLTLFIHNYEPGPNEAEESYFGAIELKKDDVKDIIDVKMEYEFEIYSDGE
ncbi:MAG: hypothetical protein LBL93_05015 [Ruminococcus sp.]|jgi:hypothetical protein|nr:hypothetical protein [Ruminococcus sp.]